MADIWMDVDTALAEVPVNILPLLDDTDFKTIEDAVAYNATGMALFWHFVTSAGAYTVTAVTPTTAGVYDWTDQGTAGIYTIEIPASGGASINNDTEGYGWFTGKCTGVLPWRGPVIGFRAAAINDALCDGGDLLDVSVTQFLGTAVSTPATAGILDVNVKNIDNDAASASGTVTFPNATLASTTNITAGTITTVTNLTNAPTAGDLTATMKTSVETATQTGLTAQGYTSTRAGYLDTLNGLVAAIWAAATSGLTTVGSIGKKLADWTIGTAQTGDSYARLGAPAGASVSADIAAMKVDTAAILVDTGTTLDARIPAALVGGRMDASVGAMAANVMTAAALATDAGAEIADAVWDEVLSGHLTAGTTGAGLNAAGSAGDPWSTAVPGAYGAGTAGKILGDNLNATVSSRLATSGYTAPLDAAGTRTAVGLASANLDTQLTAIDDFLDTEVAAIKAKTDNLPSDPADASDLTASFVTVNATLATIAGYIDTEVAAIKAKTDNLPTDPADASDIAASFSSIASTLTTIAAYIDTEVAAIKAKTDNLTFTSGTDLDVNVQKINDVTITGNGSGTPFNV